MKVLVLGLGLSGEAAAQLLIQEGHEVVCVDGKPTVVERVLARGWQAHLDSPEFIGKCAEFDFDQVILSPGWNPKHPLCRLASHKQIEMIGEAELALRHLSPQQRCIAITGTNGKTTVTLLCAHVLNHSGKYRARALGNVGDPLCSYVGINIDKEEILVVELSSYQLETMQSQAFDAAVILNITPDHLDRYPSMDAYAEAKCRLGKCLKSRTAPASAFYIYEKIKEEFPHLLIGCSSQIFGRSASCAAWTDRHQLYCLGEREIVLPAAYAQRGFHESENVLAAWLLCKELGVKEEEFVLALESFCKPAHRIEFVKTINGVSYYDDSKGTNIDAVVQAVNAMHGPVVLIAGGVDKCAPYAPWTVLLQHKVRQIITIGQAAERMCAELQEAFKIEKAETLSTAVERACALASDGDCVLLSPGCSSYDMFRDYAHRGDEFKRFVHNLNRGEKE